MGTAGRQARSDEARCAFAATLDGLRVDHAAPPPGLLPPTITADFAASFDVVHPALLEPPPNPVRGSWRTDAGIVLDRELVGLSGLHARCRHVQARLVRRLVESDGCRKLGFVRVGDYARERLGLSARTVQDDVHVLRALDTLPLLSAMLEAGALVWSRLRVLVRAATASNEAGLLEQSSRVPMRELDAFVRAFAGREGQAAAPPGRDGQCNDVRTGSGVASTAGAGAASNAGSERDVEKPKDSAPADDPLLRWSIHVSRTGRRLWNAAREFAERMEGRPLTPGEVLERVAAEAAGGAPHHGEGSCWTRIEYHERWLRRRLLEREDEGRRGLLAFLAETGVAEGFAWLDPASPEPGPARRLDLLLEGLDEADPFEVDRRLRQLRLAAQRIDFQMAALLYVGVSRSLFREIGFASVKLYVEARLGCSARTVWNLIAIERGSWRRSTALREAWRDGRVSHLAAAALLPVLDEGNARAWIERAGEVTLRRLLDEVAWAADHGGAPPAPGADVRADGSADVAREEVQKRAQGPAPGPAWERPPAAVRLDILAPLSVAVLAETTIDRLHRYGQMRWQTFEKMVALALAEWQAQPRHRDPVFERDGWRCAVPGCTSRCNLHDHHIEFRSRGGDNAKGNRLTVCAAHHLHGIHAGIVRASGHAPDDVFWELGCATGRGPLLELHGDYLMKEAA